MISAQGAQHSFHTHPGCFGQTLGIGALSGSTDLPSPSLGSGWPSFTININFEVTDECLRC